MKYFEKFEEGLAGLMKDAPRFWSAASFGVHRGGQWMKISLIRSNEEVEEPVYQGYRLRELRAETGDVDENGEPVIAAAFLALYEVYSRSMVSMNTMIFEGNPTDIKSEVGAEFEAFFNGEPFETDYAEYENASD